MEDRKDGWVSGGLARAMVWMRREGDVMGVLMA